MLRPIAYVLRQAWVGFWRHPAMSVASTLTIAGMLLLSSFFVVAHQSLDFSLTYLESKVELYVELEDTARPSEILELKERLERDPAVARVDFVSKEEALARIRELQRERGFTVAETIGNPLPASLEIKMAIAQDTGRLALDLRDEIGRGVVREVVDNPTVVDQVLTITRVLSVGGMGVLGLMLFVTMFVIVNTIRIAVHGRRGEIEIMQLVGASDWFVRWPFILEGMLVGAFGALVALAIMAAAAPPVTSAVSGFVAVVPIDFGQNFAIQLATSIAAFALLVGASGAYLSVRSHLGR